MSETAVGTDQAQKFVLTLSPTNTAAYRPVKLGPLDMKKRVVREGLKPRRESDRERFGAYPAGDAGGATRRRGRRR